MTFTPASLPELQAVVSSQPSLRIRGGGTKPGLQRPSRGAATLDLTALHGILEHTPEECTFTALAGTPVAEIERTLARYGQYLPFDPPLAGAGATIGGTAAAGVNGSGRYRYGGIRDFLIGAHIVDGRGTLVRSGGKVVKNAAGFLLHQAMVGSCGRFGVLAELTFKVFPAPEARTTIMVGAADLADAAHRAAAVQREPFELEALDIDASSTLLIRIAGAAATLPARTAAVQRASGGPAEVIQDAAEEHLWRDAREFAWVPSGTTLVRVPITPPRIAELDAALTDAAARRYAIGGHVALVAWPGRLDALSGALTRLGLTAQVLVGGAGRPFIGAIAPDEVDRRVRQVMDPDGRFGM